MTPDRRDRTAPDHHAPGRHGPGHPAPHRPALSPAALDDLLAQGRTHTGEGPAWRPVVVEAHGPDGRMDLEAVCGRRGLLVVDTLERQFEELARVRFPADGEGTRRRAFVRSAVEAERAPISAERPFPLDAERPSPFDVERASSAGAAGPGPISAPPGRPAQPLSAWVHYPWRATVVRVLASDPFFEVITNRNQHKITADEQRALRERTIGVVGLSVGGEIAFTLAQEHLCGRIVLADFDTLDLSNLNRLSAGVLDLGVNKARILARRIAELDPWIDVEVHAEGLTDDNIDAFLGGLDLLVEECDDLPMKLMIREMARERRIDLLYAADEGGFLSIEPYGRDPDLAPFHGRTVSTPRSRSDYPDATSFWRDLTAWLGGWEVISQRSRQSVLDIGDTLAGYPQLAGEPRHAAAQVAHVARRLLLGEDVPAMVVRHDIRALLDARWGELHD